jgi:glycosyltransferase involved in cell wall biosynthesis
LGRRKIIGSKGLRVIFLTKYTRFGPSSRYRHFQYFTAIESAGLGIAVAPLFGDAYMAYKYTHGRARTSDVLSAFIRRLWAVLTVLQSELVVIEYELLPYFPAWLERWLKLRRCRLVIDYDDALFHQYDQHPNWFVRSLLGNKIATVMQLAHTVIAGNAYLADYATRAGARRVQIIPTVVDLSHYPAEAAAFDSDVFTIGWIGSPSTAPYLQLIAPALAEVCRDLSARVRLIGSGPVDLPGVPVDILPWREDTEVAEMNRFDVGVMPLPDEPWTRGKCGLKLIQYMACGLPVVASPVGVNSEIVQAEVNGFLAQSTADWVAALKRLRTDKQLRRTMGAAGRARVEEKYCLEVTAPKLIGVLKRVAQGSVTAG